MPSALSTRPPDPRTYVCVTPQQPATTDCSSRGKERFHPPPHPHSTPSHPPPRVAAGSMKSSKPLRFFSFNDLQSNLWHISQHEIPSDGDGRQRENSCCCHCIRDPPPPPPLPPPRTPRSNGSRALLMWKRGQTLDGISLCSLRRWPTFSQSGAQKWSSHTLDGLALRNPARAASDVLDVPFAASHLRGIAICFLRRRSHV